MPDLLLELFSEEIPARMQRKAAGDLKKLVTDQLVDQGLTYEGAREYWTPRRLVLDVRGLTVRSADIREERKGPRTDAPEKAVQGFMRGAGLESIEQAEIRNDPKKGEFYVAVIEKPGREARDIISGMMPDIVRNFPWPKSMRWGAQSAQAGSLNWVRPLQSIICTLGVETEDPEIINFEIGDLKSSNKTRGHRFMSDQSALIEVKRFDDFSTALASANVMIDAEQRQQTILSDAGNLAFAQGLELVEDKGLLEEVAGLVEWPVVLMGEFDEDFLDIPDRVIQLTIKENQKCFVLRSNDTGKLVNKFILVSNIEASDGGREVVRGNAKVVNARLSDAKFFWESDLAQIASDDGFEPWIKKLDAVTFHAKLGTQGERVDRITELSETLARTVISQASLPQNITELAKRAAHLCKADLNSAMVYEFPEVQGQIGHIYALRANEDKAVAAAIEDHYKPLGPTDNVPSDPVSVMVALADKIDVLCGFWIIDEKPTGSKDPYALRRAALGVIRLLLENQLTLKLGSALTATFDGYRQQNSSLFDGLEEDQVKSDLLGFLHDRLKVYLRDKGIRHDLIDAVLSGEADDLLTISDRAEALQKLIDSDEGANLFAGYKRAANILSAEEKKGFASTGSVAGELLREAQEIELARQLDSVESQVTGALSANDFNKALSEMARIRTPVDAFFDSVMVNDDDPQIRSNRLELLMRIRKVTDQVADFSKIAG